MTSCHDLTISDTAQLLKSSDRILLLSHQKPDGDTLGSGFALLYALRSLGKTVRIECSDGFPERYRFIYPEFDPETQPDFTPELIVAVDIADTQLLGGNTVKWGEQINLCIDHHPSNSRYAQNLLLDTRAAATAMIIEQLIAALGVSLTVEMGVGIYTGLATDTGCFRYSNVTSECHLLAARMIETGVDVFLINKLMFETKSIARMELERMVMKTLQYHFDKQFATIVISMDAVKFTGATEDELEGIASIPRQIEGVEAAATFYQKGETTWRISLRTCERINASDICAKLGGGGHQRAAGCTVEGSLETALARILDATREKFL